LKKIDKKAVIKKNSRPIIIATVAVLVAGLVVYAAWEMFHTDPIIAANEASAAAAQSASVSNSNSSNTGGAFPEFSILAASDKTDGPAELTQNDLKGHKTVFVIFKPSCPHCHHEAEVLHRLIPEFGNKLKVVLASVGIKEESLDFGDATGMTSDIYLGSVPLATKLGIQTVPAVFLVDEQGQIRYVQMGEKDEAAEREVLKAFVEGREIPQPVGLGQE